MAPSWCVRRRRGPVPIGYGSTGMVRYRVPRIAFVNKCDRTGADPFRVARQLQEKLNQNPVLLQVPMGLEKDHRGVIDLVSMKALTFEGPNGEELTESEIPAESMDLARTKRDEMLDAVSLFSDELTEAILAEEPISEDTVQEAIRKGTLALGLLPF